MNLTSPQPNLPFVDDSKVTTRPAYQFLLDVYNALGSFLGKRGTATLVAGTVTVNYPSVTANSQIYLTVMTSGGTPGWLRVSSRVVGTSFTITSSSATDTSVIGYQIFEPV